MAAGIVTLAACIIAVRLVLNAEDRRGLYAEGGPTERPMSTFPSRRFVRAGGGGNGVVLARGETDWVFVDAKSGRPRSIPPDIQAMFDLTPAKGSTFLSGLTSAQFTAKPRRHTDGVKPRDSIPTIAN